MILNFKTNISYCIYLGFKGNATKQLNLDGVNQWNTISKNNKYVLK